MILDMHYDSLDICLTAHFMRDSSFIKTQTLDFAQTVLSEVFDVRSDTFDNPFFKDLARLANLPNHRHSQMLCLFLPSRQNFGII